MSRAESTAIVSRITTMKSTVIQSPVGGLRPEM
jgi:hypothetical protein